MCVGMCVRVRVCVCLFMHVYIPDARSLHWTKTSYREDWWIGGYLYTSDAVVIERRPEFKADHLMPDDETTTFLPNRNRISATATDKDSASSKALIRGRRLTTPVKHHASYTHA